MYSEKVMDHFKNPRNMGEIEHPKGVGTVGNAKCGDIMRMYLDIDENGVIREAKFKTFGCGACDRKNRSGSPFGHKQGGYGSTGRSSSGKSALFAFGRRGDSCGALGLCPKTGNSSGRIERTGGGYS